MSVYLGIDLGTTNLKVLLFSKERGILDFESVRISSTQRKTGWHEQDPDEWVEKTIYLMAKILQRNKNYAHEVKSIGFSGQMHGLIAVDDQGIPVRSCMTWMDQRAEEESKDITRKLDIFSITGNHSNPSFTLPKILWLKNNERINYKKSRIFFQPKDYLRYKLGKEKKKVTDKTDASATLLMDIENQEWSEQILNTFKIDSKKLPEITNSYSVVDYLEEGISRKVGLKRNIPLITGAGDQEAAAIGLGIVGKDEAFISSGTAGQVFRPTEYPIYDKNAGVHLFCQPFSGWHYLGALQNAGNVLEWCLKILNLDYQDIEKLKTNKINNLYFLPYLTGERTPVMDPNSKGVWIGLSISHTKEDLLSSVLEGISFSLKLAHSKITNILGQEDTCYLIGGVTKSKKWSQIITDILAKELLTLSIYEGSAYGASLLSAVGFGDVREEELRSFKPEIKEIFYPNDELISYYQEKYEQFVKLIKLEKKFRTGII